MEMTIGYGRKLRPDNYKYDYEHEEASIYFKGQVPDELGDDIVAQLVDQVATLFATAKIRVLTELGLEFESDEDGVVREVAKQAAEIVTAFPGSTMVQQSAQASVPAATTPQPIAQAPQAPQAPVALPAPPGGALAPAPFGPSKSDLIAMYLADPSGWWDNRGSKTSEWAPDFRHKDLDLPPNKNGKVYKAGLNVQDFRDAGYQV